jgi:hypothetical protein
MTLRRGAGRGAVGIASLILALGCATPASHSLSTAETSGPRTFTSCPGLLKVSPPSEDPCLPPESRQGFKWCASIPEDQQVIWKTPGDGCTWTCLHARGDGPRLLSGVLPDGGYCSGGEPFPWVMGDFGRDQQVPSRPVNRELPAPR